MNNAGDFNRARVFEIIHLFEPVSRAEIASRLHLTSATVSNIVAELLGRGYVMELGRRATSRGQPAIELGVQANAAHTIGLHFEHGSVAGIAADLKGHVVHSYRVPLAPLPSPEIVLSALIETAGKLIGKMPEDRILGIGLAAVGPIDHVSGSVRRTEFTSDWVDVELQHPLAEAFGLPVFMDNNATAAAIGEYWYGVGRSYQNFLYVGFYNYGLGGGLVLNGRVYRGAGLNAAEFGHMLVNKNVDENCAPRFLEHYVSGHALCRDFGPEILQTFESRLHEEDAALMRWMDAASQVFANALVSVDHLLDLDTIIVGGELPQAFFDALLARVQLILEPLYMHGWAKHATLQLGKTGLDSAAMGAATLPIYDVFSPGSGINLNNVKALRMCAAGGAM